MIEPTYICCTDLGSTFKVPVSTTFQICEEICIELGSDYIESIEPGGTVYGKPVVGSKQLGCALVDHVDGSNMKHSETLAKVWTDHLNRKLDAVRGK